ncbi:MAG TPA: serine/threonine-protein kinase [Verrucomicrobiae bacterium]|nr:serine/threonine-protein kinase [Verrucomicrobiae bacterium]
MRTHERTCTKCGRPIAAERLGGLCGRCLGRLGFAAVVDETPDENPSAGPRPPRFGQYELLEEIGRGGMGVVYKARQLNLNRLVAVKMVLQGPFSSTEFVQRFRLEAQAAAALHHPNIVAVYEVGEHQGQNYFSMEYLPGQSLAELAREKPLSAEQAAGHLKIIAEAMHYAHGEGVLHRDLKPSNVLIDMWNAPRILDFGLAKLLETDTQLTLNGQAFGSPNYMAPEQTGETRFGPAGLQADVYSLGAILYYLLTGRPPFRGETIQAVLAQVQGAEPVPPRRLNPSVPADLQTICLKCLQKEPARRYATAEELAQDLGRFLAHQPILAQPVSAARHAWLWCCRHPVPALLSGLLLATVFLGLAGIVWEWRRAELHAQGETRQRQFAEAAVEQTRKNLYAADVSLASQALQRGEYGLARRTLFALQPKSGEIDWRGFEWRYLWARCHGDQLATMSGHNWIVTCLAFSPDNQWLASGSQDGTAKIWNPARQALITTLPTTAGAVWSIGFTPDGASLMTAGNLGGVKFWATNGWTITASFPGQMASLARTNPWVAISESNPFYREALGKVSLWNYRTGNKLMEFQEPGRTLALSPDATLLAVAGPTSGVILWDTQSGALVRRLPTRNSVWSLTFSPAGDRLITAGWSAEPLVWDVRGTAAPAGLQGHSRTVWSAAFSTDGASILTVSSDETIRTWDAQTLSQKGILRGHESEVWCLAMAPDGRTLASGGKDKTVRLWPANPPALPAELPNTSANRPLFSPDGQQLVTLNVQPGEATCELWDITGHQRLAACPGATALGFSADGTRVISLNTATASVESWSQSGRSVVAKLEKTNPGADSFVRVGLSGDGGWLFAIDSAGTARLWQVSNGQQVASVTGPEPPIRAAVLSAGGKYLAAGLERENIVHLYTPRLGKELRLKGHQDFVDGLAFAPDGETLASGSVDGTIRLWECATGRELALLPGHLEETTDVAFSPDGRTLASLAHGESLKLWHLPSLREVVSLGVPDAGDFLQFSPDGRRLSLTTTRNSVRFLDAPRD